MGIRVDKSKLALALAGAGARIFGNAVVFGGVGAVLNALLLAACWRTLGKLSEPVPTAGPGLGAAVVALGQGHWKALLAGLLLVPGFPAAWFFAGKKRGIDAAVRYLVRKYKAGIVEHLVERIAAKLRTPAWAERYNRSGLRATLNEMLPGYLATLDDFPAVPRMLFRALGRRVDVGGFLLKTLDERQLVELDPAQVAEAAAARANEFIDEKLLSPSWVPVLAVLGANLVYVAALLLLAR